MPHKTKLFHVIRTACHCWQCIINYLREFFSLKEHMLDSEYVKQTLLLVIFVLKMLRSKQVCEIMA